MAQVPEYLLVTGAPTAPPQEPAPVADAVAEQVAAPTQEPAPVADAEMYAPPVEMTHETILTDKEGQVEIDKVLNKFSDKDVWIPTTATEVKEFKQSLGDPQREFSSTVGRFAVEKMRREMSWETKKMILFSCLLLAVSCLKMPFGKMFGKTFKIPEGRQILQIVMMGQLFQIGSILKIIASQVVRDGSLPN